MFLKLVAGLLVNILFLSGTFADGGIERGEWRKRCPPFWTRFQDNCYRFFGDVKLWADAEAHCNQFFTANAQGHLISIHNKAESDFVYKLWHDSLLQSNQLLCTLSTSPAQGSGPFTRIYIGANDRAIEGNWVWTDGSPFNYNEWGAGEPSDGGGNEDCAHWTDKTVNVAWRPWNDVPCDFATLYPYVCKLNVGTEVLP